MDIVIPLGKQSIWKDNELKIALRSIEKNAIGVKNIVIVGEIPTFLNQEKVIHIPVSDVKSKTHSIMNKIIAACNDPRVSDDFLFSNDDIIFTVPTEINKIPFYRKGHSLYDSSLSRNHHKYVKLLGDTSSLLLSMGYDNKHFDVHIPIIYNKEKFVSAMSKIDWLASRDGYVIKSCYCNIVGYQGEPCTDVKVNRPSTIEEIKLKWESTSFFSFGDSGLTNTLKRFLVEKFPSKSIYEL